MCRARAALATREGRTALRVEPAEDRSRAAADDGRRQLLDRRAQFFRALADPTRRDILRRCAAGEPSVSRLAEAYPMSFAAVQKHVAVMERAGLISKERRGREQLVRTEAEAVGRVRQALDDLETTWRGRVDRMSALLAQDQDPQGR